ncbi:hypothetical protein BROUX41_000663 [Berkeleyomyces rouxiae]|uniref:uncharacterized protein n=1 Tax=Berkeleyomyces rouxiae TaxID=2035830 RepID=UPI003B81DAB6
MENVLENGVRSSPPLRSSPPIDDGIAIPSRPNRWTGSASTWRGLTAEERNLVESLDQQRDLDLGVQLFNIHVLKRNGLRARKRLQKAQRAEGVAVQNFSDSDDVANAGDTYVPPQRWTAWPVRKELLPRDDFMGASRGSTEDDRFTFRHSSASHPRQVIKEELTATVLRLAKERFLKRMEAAEKIRASIEEPDMSEVANDGDDETSDDDDESESSSSDESESDSAQSDGEVKDEEYNENTQYEAVVSADDDLSEKILQPSIQHIMAKVDDMLRVLHNSRMTTISYMHDGSSSDSEENNASGKEDSKPPPATSSDTSNQPSKAKDETSAVESERRSPKPLPIDPRLLSEPLFPFPSAQATASSQPTAATGAPTQIPAKKATTAAYTASQRSQHRGDWLGRWNLRNWQDILFAASHAGFPHAVLARTAQRCVDLFDESITLTSMPETAPQGLASAHTETHIVPRPDATRYQPVDPVIAALNTGNDADTEGNPRVLEVQRLRAQFAHGSRPGSASLRLMYCSVATCQRATRGFDRYSNLQRHVVKVHNMTPPPPPSASRSRSRSRSRSKETPSRRMRRAGTPGVSLPGSGVEDVTTDTENEDAYGMNMEEDSEDEMDGVVHVDGFLKPFRLKRGWRGGDIQERRQPRSPKKRRVDIVSEDSIGTLC